eukprot:250611-Prymnesium_polylepis.1
MDRLLAAPNCCPSPSPSPGLVILVVHLLESGLVDRGAFPSAPMRPLYASANDTIKAAPRRTHHAHTTANAING